MRTKLPSGPAIIPWLGMYAKEYKAIYFTDCCIVIRFIVLLTVVKLWSQPNLP